MAKLITTMNKTIFTGVIASWHIIFRNQSYRNFRELTQREVKAT